MKNAMPAAVLDSDAEFVAARELLNSLVAKKDHVDSDLNAAWREREVSIHPNGSLAADAIQRASSLEPGVERDNSAHQAWLRKPSVLQAQSYELQLAVNDQAQRLEIARGRASNRALATVGAPYLAKSLALLAAVDALIEASADVRTEMAALRSMGLVGFPEVGFPVDAPQDQLAEWRTTLAEMVEGLKQRTNQHAA